MRQTPKKKNKLDKKMKMLNFCFRADLSFNIFPEEANMFSSASVCLKAESSLVDFHDLIVYEFADFSFTQRKTCVTWHARGEVLGGNSNIAYQK